MCGIFFLLAVSLGILQIFSLWLFDTFSCLYGWAFPTLLSGEKTKVFQIDPACNTCIRQHPTDLWEPVGHQHLWCGSSWLFVRWLAKCNTNMWTPHCLTLLVFLQQIEAQSTLNACTQIQRHFLWCCSTPLVWVSFNSYIRVKSEMCVQDCTNSWQTLLIGAWGNKNWVYLVAKHSQRTKFG